MRSFFKKPSWASRGDDGADSEFYRRADQTYKDIVAASKTARERSPNPGSSKPCKRPRILNPSTDINHQLEGFENDTQVKDAQKELSRLKPPLSSPSHDPSVSLSMIQNIPTSEPPEVEKTKHAIASITHSSSNTRAPSPDTNNPCSYSMAGGILKNIASETPKLRDTSANNLDQLTTVSQNSTCEDVVVQILITSRIENTKPLIIQRKLTQSLKDVRLAWCNHQNLPRRLYSSVFLTWKGRRLFDVTTCRSLELDGKGARASHLGLDSYSNEDADSIRIHMEAVTDDILSLGRQTQYMNGPSLHLNSAESTNEGSHLTSIVLKSPGYADYRMEAKLDMQVSQIISAFLDARKVPMGQDVYIVFDGDRLDPQSRLSEHEVTDDDLLDVMIKPRGERILG